MAVLVLIVLSVVGGSVYAAEEEWRLTDPKSTAVLELDAGEVIIELNPGFASATVAQFTRLLKQGFYDGLSFYRVIDAFVAQAGDGSDIGEPSEEPSVKAEFERDWSDDLHFSVVQKPDLFAPETGFIEGFAAARDMEAGTVWLTHCPGTVAMARGDEPDSSRTDFYIVIGQAPRYLDRNLTIFGRVVYGMEHIQSVRRGPPSRSGIIETPDERSIIRTAQLAADLPLAERPMVEVRDSNSAEFRAMLEARRHREADFFHHTPPPVLDVCQVPNMGRLSSRHIPDSKPGKQQ